MLSTIRKLFTPHSHNNQKASILHQTSLLILLGMYIMAQSAINIFTSFQPGVLGYASYINPDKIIEYTNQYRLQEGKEPLVLNDELTQAALAKAQDMFTDNYWAHISPDGTEPWYFIAQSGYEYAHAGENLARDFTNPQSVVDAWIDSPSHRKNILESDFKEIGIAVVDGDIGGVETTIVVQLFGTSGTSSVFSAQTGQIIGEAQASSLAAKSFTGISPLDLSRTVSLTFVILLIITLAFDWFYVWRKRIVRISGNSWAHLTYLVAIAIMLIIFKQGLIL